MSGAEPGGAPPPEVASPGASREWPVEHDGLRLDRESRQPVTPDEAIAEAEFAGAPADSPGGEAPPSRPETPGEAIAEAELAHAPEDLAPSATWATTRLARLGPTVPIGGGAVLGANARYFVEEWAAANWPGSFPWGTLLINATGSLIIGFYLTLVTERFAGRASTRLFVATGFLGAYTTFSTFSYETVALVRQGLTTAAIAYVVASLALGLAAVVAGALAARAL